MMPNARYPPQGSPTNPSQKTPSQSDVDKAAECINAFRQAALAAMQKNCGDNEAHYNSRAGTPAERAAALQERDAAYNALQDAKNATPPNQAAIDQAQRDYNKAAGRHSRMQHSACLGEQAAFIRSGSPPPPLRAPTHTGHDPGPPANGTTQQPEPSGGM
jgi:hypothetical protein